MCDVDNERQYLVKAFTFLKRYQWLFKHKNTDIFTEEVLTNLSKQSWDYCDSLTVPELHNFLTGTAVKQPIPTDLKNLIDDVKCLSVNDEAEISDQVEVGNNAVGLCRKKAHEIALLTPIINEVCHRNGCDVIVDVGSGVGHLSHLLCTKYNYPVLALEASSTLVETAIKMQQKHNPQCINKVVFQEHFVSENSSETINQQLKEHFPNAKKIGLVGLHACADLSVEVLKLYSNLPEAACLVIMPCCYHRMNLVDNDSEGERFNSFPASQLGLALFSVYEGGGFLNRQFLRLACQQSLVSFVRMSEEEHKLHAQHCVHRAVLELVAKSENCGVRRLKRKSGKSTAPDSDGGFVDYLNNLPQTHKLVGDGGISVTDARFLFRMREKWNERKNDCWLVEVLMGLQAAIQAVCENVILLDRVAFLKEKRLHCCMRKITNDAVSPRCWALISERNTRTHPHVNSD